MAKAELRFEVIANTKKLEDLNRRLNQFEKQSKQSSSASRSLDNSIKGTIRSVGALTVGYIALNEAIEQGQAILDVALRLEAIDERLKYVADSTKGAKTEFEFISTEASRLNQNILVLGEGYSKFAAGAKNTLSESGIKQAFTGLIEGATALKISNDDINGALLAFTQIASKGKVQAEELRGQIGERIPGAFTIAAKAMGVTEQKLNKMLETGQVLSKDFLPAFGREMSKEFGERAVQSADSGRGAINQFNNAVIELRSTLSEMFDEPARAVTEFATALVRGIDIGIKQTELRISNLGIAFKKLSTGTMLEFAKSARGSFGIFANIIGASATNIQELQAEFDGLNDKTASNVEEWEKLQRQWNNLDRPASQLGFIEKKIDDSNKSLIQFGDTSESMFGDIEPMAIELGSWAYNLKIAEEAALGVSRAIDENIDGIEEFNKALEAEKQFKAFEDTLKSSVEGALASGINDALNGKFDLQSFANQMKQAVIGAVAQGMAASAVQGMGSGALLGVAAGAGVASMLFNRSSKPQLSFDEKADRRFDALISAIEENTEILAMTRPGTALAEKRESVEKEIADTVSKMNKLTSALSDLTSKGMGNTRVAGDIQFTLGEEKAYLSELELQNTKLQLEMQKDLAGFTEITATQAEKFISKSGANPATFLEDLERAGKKANDILLGLTNTALSDFDEKILEIAQNLPQLVDVLAQTDDVLGQHIERFSKYVSELENSANAFQGVINSLDQVTASQQNFIDKNILLTKTGAESVDYLQERFNIEKQEAEEARNALQAGTMAGLSGAEIAELTARVAKEEGDVLAIGQSLIDQAGTTFASTEQAQNIIQGVLNDIDANQTELLSVSEQLTVRTNEILEELLEEQRKANALMELEQIASTTDGFVDYEGRTAVIVGS